MNEAIRKKKSTGTLFSDLELFVQACKENDDAGEVKSIAEIAKKLGLSPSGLISCFKRLASFYECELIESKENIAGFTLNDLGKDVLERSSQLFEEFSALHANVIQKASRGRHYQTVRVCTSPYLLANIFPNLLSGFQYKDDSKIIKAECIEGYHTQEVLNDILSGKVEIAVLWGYPEKIQKARLTKGISYMYASTKIEVAFIFGKNHRKFYEWEKTNIRPTAFIDELASETLFHLEEDHQPFYDMIPLADLNNRGKRIEFTTITSIIGSIRAGMNGVAILPAVFKDIDKYRREGNLYFVPLERTREAVGRKENKLFLRIIYIFKGNKNSQSGLNHIDSIPKFTKPDGTQKLYSCLNAGAQKILEHIDSNVLPVLGDPSGWDMELKPGITLTHEDIVAFEQALHISPNRIGFSEPEWKYSTIHFELSPGKKNKEGSYIGYMNLNDDAVEGPRRYLLEARLVDNTVFCVIGRLADPHTGDVDQEKSDSFVAVFGFQDPDRSFLLGVASAQDDSGTSPLIGTIAIFKDNKISDPHFMKQLALYMQSMKNRTLIRTDVRNRIFQRRTQ